jgi:hypothetical protein
LAAILVMWTGAGGLAAQDYQSLAEVLKQESIPFPPTSIPHLNAEISSFATLNDTNEFVIAYYLADRTSQRLLSPLLITRFDKIAGKWQHASVEDNLARWHGIAPCGKILSCPNPPHRSRWRARVVARL